MLLLWLARDDYHLAFLGLAEAQVKESHYAAFAKYCHEVVSAQSARARLKLIVSLESLTFRNLIPDAGTSIPARICGREQQVGTAHTSNCKS